MSSSAFINVCNLLWRVVPLALLLCVLPVATGGALASDVLIIGDIQFRQVADVAAEMKAVVRSQAREVATGEIKGRLESVVARENPRVIVALGLEAIAEATRLREPIPIVYGLVIAPPKSGRANMTGVYMSTPVSEYFAVARRYLPSISRFSVVGSHTLMSFLLDAEGGHITPNRVNSSPELMSAVNRTPNAHALLLLPDANLLTASVMEKIFLFSFRESIPVLGFSEGNVKQGALFALVFEPKGLGRQIGEKVNKVLMRGDTGDLPTASPPKKFNLFINTNTAKKMNISIPDEMLKKAKKVYP